jgi:magnesium and cobalt transporter
MSDEHPHSSHGSPRKKWLERLSHLFQGEPKDRNDLVEVIQDAEERDVIDEDTKEMIEGVLEVSELRVRDIMIPRTQMITIRRHPAGRCPRVTFSCEEQLVEPLNSRRD